MNNNKFLALAVGLICFCYTAIAEPIALWQFEEIDGGITADCIGNFDGIIQGNPSLSEDGVVGKCLLLNGEEDYVEIDNSSNIIFSDATFSVAAWVNLYEINRGKQMIIAKNDYAAGSREWGLMIDNDNRFKLYLRHGGWQTISSATIPEPGHWYHIAVTLDNGYAKIYVNGELENQTSLGSTITGSSAPITIGAVNSGGNLMQMFYGAVDEIKLTSEILSAQIISDMASIETTPHDIPTPELVEIWTGDALPNSDDIPVLKNVEFSVIKKWQPDVDGYNWLHGVALVWHNDRLYASFGLNEVRENVAGEKASARISEDQGKTWGELFDIAVPEENDLGISHGVFLSYQGDLWAFLGALYGVRTSVHTRAYRLNEQTDNWDYKGVIIEGGFWPLQEPQRMDDGNWIMGGVSIGDGHPAAVAISNGDDFTDWDLVIIPKAPGRMWGESSVILDGNRIINIARYHGESQTVALVAFSDDYGRTWTQSKPSNMNMVASKPYTGTLSTGQHYLIGTTTADSGNTRRPLTIAVTRPGEYMFSKVFVIRHAVVSDVLVESHPNALLSYPYAIEHQGKLYVGYSNDGYRGRGNLNSAEMAVIPISELKVD